MIQGWVYEKWSQISQACLTSCQTVERQAVGLAPKLTFSASKDFREKIPAFDQELPRRSKEEFCVGKEKVVVWQNGETS